MTINKTTKNALKRVRNYLIGLVLLGLLFGMLIGLAVALVAF